MTEAEKTARKIVRKWLWDCGEGNIQISFVQSELLQQRIVEALHELGDKAEKPNI